jgi:hypothetical protein
MERAVELSHGWSLFAEWNYRTERGRVRKEGILEHARYTMDLWFKHRDGRMRNPLEFAAVPEAREVFRHLKRKLDEMDDARARPGLDFEWNAADRGLMALRLSLQTLDRWSDDLMVTDFEPEGVNG